MAVEIWGSEDGLKEAEVVISYWSVGTHQVHATLALSRGELAQPTDASSMGLTVTCCLGSNPQV